LRLQVTSPLFEPLTNYSEKLRVHEGLCGGLVRGPPGSGDDQGRS